MPSEGFSRASRPATTKKQPLYYAAQACNTSRAHVWYWKKRFLDPTFKSSSNWGGFRKATFLPTEKVLVHDAIIHLLSKNPFLRLGALASMLSCGFQRRVTRSVLSRILTDLRWSWKVPVHVQLHKFRPENVIRYFTHILNIAAIPWHKIKFADEAHVVSKQLRSKKVLSLISQRKWVSYQDLHDKSFSVTLLTCFT